MSSTRPVFGRLTTTPDEPWAVRAVLTQSAVEFAPPFTFTVYDYFYEDDDPDVIDGYARAGEPKAVTVALENFHLEGVGDNTEITGGFRAGDVYSLELWFPLNQVERPWGALWAPRVSVSVDSSPVNDVFQFDSTGPRYHGMYPVTPALPERVHGTPIENLYLMHNQAAPPPLEATV